MNRYDCETVRDLLPPRVREELLPHEAVAVEAHVATCAGCAQEAAVVRLVFAARLEVPASLEPRVLAAVRRGVPVRRWAPGRLAMAATVAAAVLGGTLVFERAGFLPPGQRPMVEFDIQAASVLSWAAAEDPLLHGTSTLQQLSVEELELILEELDS